MKYRDLDQYIGQLFYSGTIIQIELRVIDFLKTSLVPLFTK